MGGLEKTNCLNGRSRSIHATRNWKEESRNRGTIGARKKLKLKDNKKIQCMSGGGNGSKPSTPRRSLGCGGGQLHVEGPTGRGDRKISKNNRGGAEYLKTREKQRGIMRDKKASRCLGKSSTCKNGNKQTTGKGGSSDGTVMRKKHRSRFFAKQIVKLRIQKMSKSSTNRDQNEKRQGARGEKIPTGDHRSVRRL